MTIAIQGAAVHRAQAAGAVGAAGAAALYVRSVDPSVGGWFPSCPLHALTGIWCPACGMTRAAHHLLNGEVIAALSFNLLVVPVLVGLIAASVARIRPVRAGPTPPITVPTKLVYIAIGAVAAFTVARNLPAFGLLRGVAA